jgi:choline dehydrogenase-like flavoprotein
MFGCPIGTKASTDVTYWPKALRKGAVLKTWARVRDITLDKSGHASGAVYYDREGKLQEQSARVVVVCANGIGTPRLLLNSKSNLFPNGLANSSGLFGKNFMVHPFRFVEGLFEARMDGHDGPFGIPAFSQEFYETDLQRGFVRGYMFQPERSFGPLHHAWGSFVGKPVPWGAAHHQAMRRRFPHVIRVTVLGEDLPEEQNRVELDPVARDSSGIPAPRVIYGYSENSLKMLEHARQSAVQALEAAGAIETTDSGVIQPAFHLLGTARMGSDPKRSVVNAWNQAHDVPNLFVVDGGCFTTSAGVNPTHRRLAPWRFAALTASGGGAMNGRDLRAIPFITAACAAVLAHAPAAWARPHRRASACLAGRPMAGLCARRSRMRKPGDAQGYFNTTSFFVKVSGAATFARCHGRKAHRSSAGITSQAPPSIRQSLPCRPTPARPGKRTERCEQCSSREADRSLER